MNNSGKFALHRLLGLIILVVLLGHGLPGCSGSKITKENFDKIKLGMTQQEVEGILGPPTEASAIELPVISGTTSKWARGDVVITVQFLNGKVMAKEFSKPPQ